MIGDPVSMMYYDGDMYYNGTKVKLKDEYIKTHTFYGKKIWKYARFDNITTYNNCRGYFFCITKDSLCDLLSMGYKNVEERNAIVREHAPYFIIPCHELHNAIEEIIVPLKVEQNLANTVQESIVNRAFHPKKDSEVPGMTVLWIIYILALIGSLIFKQFYLLWIVETLLFTRYRKVLRGE